MCIIARMSNEVAIGGRWYPQPMKDRLRAARVGLGMEQEEFARVSGISRNTVSNYEQGHTAPRGPYLERWARICGCDLNWLITGTPPTDDDGGPGGVVVPFPPISGESAGSPTRR
jgi:DNA-binding XRE family transcriptional regulator